MKPDSSNQVLAAHLNRLLEGQELSRMALARRMGVSDGTLGRIKYGTANPTVEVIDRIARHFRVKPWELLCPLDETADGRSSLPGPELIPGLHEELAALDAGQQQALLAMLRALR